MRLSKIVLSNFRCFSSLEVDFHPEMTVLVAENGQGKSSVLDAVRIALWPFVSSFDLARNAFSDPGNVITVDDVRIVKGHDKDMIRQLPCEISATGDFGIGSEKTWSRYRDSEARRRSSSRPIASAARASNPAGAPPWAASSCQGPRAIPVRSNRPLASPAPPRETAIARPGSLIRRR